MQITTDTSQIKKLLESSQRILLTTKREATYDGVGSMLALGHILQKQDKAVTFLVEDVNKGKFSFLPGHNGIQSKLPPKSLIVSIDLKGNPIEKINYETKDGRLDLIITPKQGEISAESIEFFETNLNFDLVVIFDTKELSLLGKVAEVHAEGLKKVPILNIDVDTKNLQFGKINFIDDGACASSEALLSLLQEFGFSVEANEATALLTGIVEKTRGFRQNVSARTFATASTLTKAGGNLNLINQNVLQESKVAVEDAISPLIR